MGKLKRKPGVEGETGGEGGGRDGRERRRERQRERDASWAAMYIYECGPQRLLLEIMFNVESTLR